ncbi:MAG: UDP-3-O-(3-hydroxymyristoyl)glucosamine N-acyltransferase [Desulfohalobiaceae bacterium]|nr:UDP-3-O-(3-hydroxymyristoyl)glucosamine N-acyltransferase [Desulfohalobiaceae bacterium]
MSWTTSRLAAALGLDYQGRDRELSGCNTLEKAGASELSFLANPKYISLASQTKAGAVIAAPEQAHLLADCILSPNPYLDFARAVRFFANEQGRFQGHSEMAYIHPEARIDDDVSIYPFAFIGPGARIASGTICFSGVYVGEDCEIGPDCRLYPQVSVMAGTVLGRGVVLHPGVVVGSDGFGFAQGDAALEKVPQIGRVVIEDGVEVGANTTIDRAALHETRIGAGTKIDNLVQIGHNVQIGEQCIIVSQVGISGSCKLGRNVVLAGQAGLGGHITIGDNSRVGGKAGVSKSVKPGKDVSGNPAIEHRKYLRSANLFGKLPELYQRIKKLESCLKRLQTDRATGEHSHD